MALRATAKSRRALCPPLEDERKQMDEKEIIWRELEKDIDLYKFYLDVIIKSAIFVFGITGGIISYYFANESKPLIQYSLIFPTIMNGGFFLICVFSIKFTETLKNDHYRVCEKAGVLIPYEMSPLSNILRLFSVMYGLSTVGLVILLVKNIF